VYPLSYADTELALRELLVQRVLAAVCLHHILGLIGKTPLGDLRLMAYDRQYGLGLLQDPAQQGILHG
jgi:hypothetical protein